MAFYTELPQDKWGNRGYTNAKARVIEMVVEPAGYGGEHYRVLQPGIKEFPWPTLALYSRFVEVSGPVRTLTEQEYVEVLQAAGVNPAVVEIARQRV